MVFQKKILEKTTCPRCNNPKAELRIDVHQLDTDRLLVYLVCNICALKVYRFTTNQRAVKIQTKINKLTKILSTLEPTTQRAYSIRRQIAWMRKERAKHENGA